MFKVHPPFHEFVFETTRASGAGGQHVNKTDSAVILRWKIRESTSFPPDILQKLDFFFSRQLTREGELLIKSSEQRSQKQNKDACVEKWMLLVQKALKPKIKRVATKPTRSSQRKRVEGKRIRSDIKKLRGKINDVD